MHDHFEMPTAKRQKVLGASATRRPSQAPMNSMPSPKHRGVTTESPSHSRRNSAAQGPKLADSRRQSESLEPGTAAASPTTSKPRRVRTGCLTCRTRHLKCDEAMPICLNCQKSNRKCERGVRLNFIDLKVEQPPYLLPRVDWNVRFQDESRLIASEYVGGVARYAQHGQQVATPTRAAVMEAETGAHRAIDPLLTDHRHYAENPRMGHPPSALGLCYPGSQSRSLHEPAYAAYDDQMGQMFPRKSSDSYLAIGSGPTPTLSHSGGGGRTAFGLGTVHEPYGVREETTPHLTHGYKTSDVSSVGSSFVPQGVAVSSSGSFRHATGSGAPDPHDGLMTPQSEKNGERDYLNSPEEVQYMQVFIEEVAVWMDSLDNQKHFGRVVPYLALKSPMLLNAFLACGVKHLTLVDGHSYKDDKALYYYDTATTQLLRSLQNPERNTAECATTAVVLNVYEIMSEKPAARMNHIAGARALIRECKWDATSTGIGAACFWLNVGMEVLSCLACNWATAWDPDHWGVNPDELMQMTTDSPGSGAKTPSNSAGRVPFPAEDYFPSATSIAGGVGEEEVWVHRILYIIAKVANFRANIPQFQEPSPHDEQVRQQSRFAEWQRLKTWCDTWNANCPRSMRPYGYLFTSSTKSAFPNVWLIKRSAIVGRLFYHTAMCLLAQINPLKVADHDDDEIRPVQLHHAHQVCGIIAHTKDHGVASVAIRSLAIAGSVLHEPREQHEVLDMLTRIFRTTGWNLNRIHRELKRAWGWEPPEAPPPQQQPPTLLNSGAQGGTLGAAAVVSQLFGPRTAEGGAADTTSTTTTTTPRSTIGPPAPVHPPAMATPNETRRANFTTGPPPPSTTLGQPLFMGGQQLQQHGSGTSSVPATTTSASNYTSPAASTTPGGATSAPTPPGNNRPTVNPLLAQADFTQPNHPYRDWYKPPERTAGAGGASGGFKAGAGLWPY